MNIARRNGWRALGTSVALVIAVAVLLSAAALRRVDGQLPTADGDPILAMVNGEEIRLSHLQTQMDMLTGQTTVVPTEVALSVEEAREEALQQAITTTLLLQEIARRGITVDADSVEAAWFERKGDEDQSVELSDEAAFQRSRYGISEEDWEVAARRNVETALMLNELSNQLATGVPTPTSGEIAAKVAASGLHQRHLTLLTLVFTDTVAASSLFAHLEDDLDSLEADAFRIHMLDHGWDAGIITDGIQVMSTYTFDEETDVPESVWLASQAGAETLSMYEDGDGVVRISYVISIQSRPQTAVSEEAIGLILEERRAAAMESEVQRLFSEATIIRY